MSWSKLSKSTNFLPYFKNLQHVPFATRGIHEAQGSSYLVIGSYTRYKGGSGHDVWGLMSRCKYSTGSFTRHPFFAVSSRRLVRTCSFFSPQRHYASHATTEQKSQKMLIYLTTLVFAMVGCSYAAVPLYRRFCQATGYGGTIQRRESVEEKIARHAQDGTVTTREIVVQFNADVADGMQWKFVPTQREVRVKPGESALAFYTAENKSSTPITGVSTYNVTPMKAAIYFNKIQCFCFEEQRLLPGEQIDMPVFFYIDPEFETDSKMDGINNIVLSYTFFKVSDEKVSEE